MRPFGCPAGRVTSGSILEGGPAAGAAAVLAVVGAAELEVVEAAVLRGAGVLFVVHAAPTTSTPIAILPTQMTCFLIRK